jgi:hypothetical protein
MKLQVSPLVLAAALGLLGPAALEDGDESRVSGLWKRAGRGTEPPEPNPPGGLGDRIEVLTLEDRVLLDDGSGTLSAAPGTWETRSPDLLVQRVELEGATVVREFASTTDGLVVEVRIERDGRTETWS